MKIHRKNSIRKWTLPEADFSSHAFSPQGHICSDKEEFVHDQLVHLIPSITLAFSTIDPIWAYPTIDPIWNSSDFTYTQETQRLRSKIEALNRMIDTLESELEDKKIPQVFRTFLGMLVDEGNAINDLIELCNHIDNITFSGYKIMGNPFWHDYLMKRYGDDYKLHVSYYIEVWNYLTDLADKQEEFSMKVIMSIFNSSY